MNSVANNLPIEKLLKLNPFAVEQLADFGLCCRNPIVGLSDKETYGYFADVFAFLHGVFSEGEIDPERMPGIRLLVQTAWAAAQYETFRRQPEGIETDEDPQP